MFYKVWWKVFGVVESEYINGFSKFWKKFFDPEKPYGNTISRNYR